MSERIVIERKVKRVNSGNTIERDVVLCPRVGRKIYVRHSGYITHAYSEREGASCAVCPYLLVIRADYVVCRYKYLKAYENAEIDHFWR